MLATLDPDGAALDDEEAVRARELSLARGPDGMTVIRGRLDAEGAAVLRSRAGPVHRPGPVHRRRPGSPQPGPTAGGRVDRTGPPRPRRRGPARDRWANGRRSPSPSTGRLSAAGWGRRSSAGAGRSPRSRPGGSPATPNSSPSCSARPGNRWTSGGPATPSRSGSAARWWPGTAAARSPAATGRPPGATDTTSTHWADGGPTAITNLVLLCGHHHRTIHHHDWQVRLDQRLTRVPAATLDRPRPDPAPQPAAPPARHARPTRADRGTSRRRTLELVN